MPKISCIVPIYKVAPYLHRCVDSILAQTFTDFEVILVDDGSPDNCGAICDEYATKDNRIHVIHKGNGGLSSARNAGIDWAFENSDSEYLAFIDSDDWVSEFYLEKLYNAMIETNSDLVACNYVYRINDKNYLYRYWKEAPNLFNDNILTKEKAFQDLLRNFHYVLSVIKLYKKDIFKTLRFHLNKCHEDEFIIHHVFNHCETVTTISDCLYYYCIRDDSIMKSETPTTRLDAFEAYIERLEFYENFGFKFNGIYASCFHEMRMIFGNGLMNENEVKRYKELKQRYKKFYLKKPKFKQLLRWYIPEKIWFSIKNAKSKLVAK